MIYLCDSIPHYCPQCGSEQRLARADYPTRSEFWAGVSHHCSSKGCETVFQYVSKKSLIAVARKCGDLWQYVPED